MELVRALSRKLPGQLIPVKLRRNGSGRNENDHDESSSQLSVRSKGHSAWAVALSLSGETLAPRQTKKNRSRWCACAGSCHLE